MTNNDVSFHLGIRKLLEFYGGAPYISGGFSGFIVPGLTEQGYFALISQAIKEVFVHPGYFNRWYNRTRVRRTGRMAFSREKAGLIEVGRVILEDSLWAKGAM